LRANEEITYTDGSSKVSPKLMKENWHECIDRRVSIFEGKMQMQKNTFTKWEK
jgi:hypothetical protein